MMLWFVAWRNVWRSKLRSFIILIAIALGIFAGVFSIAFLKGMAEQRVQTAIKTEVSHIQLHAPGYMESHDIENTIVNADSIQQIIEKMEAVKSATNRLIVNAMISSAETASGVKLVGINPINERNTTDIHSKLNEGSYFEKIKNNPIVIGKKLAQKLNVKLRSKLVVTLQDLDGSITGAAFRVEGIYNTVNSAYDESNAFVRYSDLNKLLKATKGSGHEIAVLLKSNEILDENLTEIKNNFNTLDVQSWNQIQPEVGLVDESLEITMIFFIMIILIALGLGIINTMLMAILERVKELGMLMAIGMNKRKVFFMIVLETVMLAFSGGLIGIFMGVGITELFGFMGINLSAFQHGLESFGYSTLVYPSINFNMIILISFLIVLTGILSSVYPAYKAIKLKPAEALRIDV